MQPVADRQPSEYNKKPHHGTHFSKKQQSKKSKSSVDNNNNHGNNIARTFLNNIFGKCFV